MKWPHTANFDPRSLAHCRLCRDPMYFIYDWKLRDYCHECMVDMSMENARRILGTK